MNLELKAGKIKIFSICNDYRCFKGFSNVKSYPVKTSDSAVENLDSASDEDYYECDKSEETVHSEDSESEIDDDIEDESVILFKFSTKFRF